jgi:hypothetical protein
MACASPHRSRRSARAQAALGRRRRSGAGGARAQAALGGRRRSGPGGASGAGRARAPGDTAPSEASGRPQRSERPMANSVAGRDRFRPDSDGPLRWSLPPRKFGAVPAQTWCVRGVRCACSLAILSAWIARDEFHRLRRQNSSRREATARSPRSPRANTAWSLAGSCGRSDTRRRRSRIASRPAACTASTKASTPWATRSCRYAVAGWPRRWRAVQARCSATRQRRRSGSCARLRRRPST